MLMANAEVKASAAHARHMAGDLEGAGRQRVFTRAADGRQKRRIFLLPGCKLTEGGA